jgi:MerR family transcriptional regulator, copper efflux regulator
MEPELHRLALRHGVRPGAAEAVGPAAARLGTTPRMLRYAESLGLLAPCRTPGGYRSYGERDLLAFALTRELEAEHGVTPAAVAFGLRALTEPGVAGRLRTLARLAGRDAPARAAALDFDQGKARRLLRLAG